MFIAARWRLLVVMLAALLGFCLIACDEDDDDDDNDDAPAAVTRGEVFAGAAEGDLDVSVGMPLAGFTGRIQEYMAMSWFTGGLTTRLPDDRTSPFADKLFPSIGLHTIPNAKAVAIGVDRDDAVDDYLVFCRVELAYVTDALRRRVELLASADLGFDVTDRVIVNATHTHNGPGRYWPLPYFADISFDTYDAGITERLARSIANVVVEAFRNMRPAKIGMTVLHDYDPQDELFIDRRAVNDELDLLTNDNPYYVDANGDLVPDGQPDGAIKDDRLTLIRVDGQNGFPIATLFSFPVHGTVLGAANLYMSGDLPAIVERKVSEAIGRPSPVVMYFQGPCGDINPTADSQGFAAAEELAEFAVHGILYANEVTQTSSEMDGIKAVGATIRQDRGLLGYDGAVHPYDAFEAPVGAALCGLIVADEPFYCLSRPELQVPDDWYAGVVSWAVGWYFCQIFDLCEDDLMMQVVEEYNPQGEPYIAPLEVFYERYHVAMFEGLQRRIVTNDGTLVDDRPSDVFLLSQPGEPLTTYSYQLRGALANALASAGVVGVTVDDLIVVGLSQDSFGYLVPKKDWLSGGYEISINTWGPLWAEYVDDTVTSLALELVGREENPFKRPIIERSDPVLNAPTPVASGLTAIVEQPQDGGRFDSFQMRWIGGDPAVDTPVVTLQRRRDDAWEDVKRDDGSEVNSGNGPEIILFYETENIWRAFWELAVDDPGGTYRFVVNGHDYDGGEQSDTPPFFTGIEYVHASEAFQVGRGGLDLTVGETRPDLFQVDALYPDNTDDGDANTADHFRYRPYRPSDVSYTIVVTDFDNPETVFNFEGDTRFIRSEPVPIELDEVLPPARYVIEVEMEDAFGNRGDTRVIRQIL